MNDKINGFIKFLNSSLTELEDINSFIKSMPKLIEKSKINLTEYQKKIDEYELVIYRIINQKLNYLKEISNLLNIKPNDLTMKLLYNMGYTQILTVSNKLQNLINDLPYSILRTSIYLKNYISLNRRFQKLNSTLNNSAYSHTGEEVKRERISSFSKEA